MNALAHSTAITVMAGAVQRGIRFQAPCPVCGPVRKGSAARRRVLALFKHADRQNPGAIAVGYNCVRCGLKGLARSLDKVAAPDPAVIEQQRVKAEKAEADEARRRVAGIATARLSWSRAKPIEGTIAETYLRQHRGYADILPATLRFLPAGMDRHHPEHAALIGAAGPATETDDGFEIDDAAVEGLIRIYLNQDGSKASIGKKSLGAIKGNPVWVRPVNDGLGLVICEGIEDAISLSYPLGIGGMAVGGAGFFEAAAKSIPPFVETVLLAEDDNVDGRMGCDAAERVIRSRTDWMAKRPPEVRRLRTWEAR